MRVSTILSVASASLLVAFHTPGECQSDPGRAARQLPNDIELKATYCTAITKTQLAQVTADRQALERDLETTRDQAEKNNLSAALNLIRTWEGQQSDNLNRLQLFIQPRMSYLDSFALLGAYRRGEADFQLQERNENPQRCMRQCQAKPAKELESCFAGCTSTDALSQRVFQCRDLKFMPY